MHAMTTYRGVEIELHLFWNSKLYKGVCGQFKISASLCPRDEVTLPTVKEIG